MPALEAFIGAIGKYSWRIFLGIFCADGFLLYFAKWLGISEWLRAYQAWAWGILILCGVISATYLMTYQVDRRLTKIKKGKIHFFADAYNNGWSTQHDTQMNLRVCGTFTFSDGAAEILIMKVYLKGTESLDDVHPQFIIRGGQTASADHWLMIKDSPQKVMLHLRLKPVIGHPKRPLRAKLILKDHLHREFNVGEVEFPYSGA